MDAFGEDNIPMLSSTNIRSDSHNDSTRRGFSTRPRSASMSIPPKALDSEAQENSLVDITGPLRNERRASLIQMSGPLYVSSSHEVIFQPPQHTLEQKPTDPEIESYYSIDGMDNNGGRLDDYEGNDPYCTTYNVEGHQKHLGISEIDDAKFHSILHGDAKGCAKRMCSFLLPYIPGVINPYAKVVQQWNKYFLITCVFAIYLDTFFFFLMSVQQDHKCIVLNWPMATKIMIPRSVTDFIYLIHILLQFRLAYVAPKSRVMGAGDLVDDPNKIVQNYLLGYFIIDFFAALPLPQIIMLLKLPDSLITLGLGDAKELLSIAILFQLLPRLYRFLRLIVSHSQTGFIFESVGAILVASLFTYVLASHVVGSCWYLFGLQRMNQCLKDACRNSNMEMCVNFVDCGHGYNLSKFENELNQWKSSGNTTACLVQDGFGYGIYGIVVDLATHQNLVTRYVYSLFWGLQQISTLAGNQVPSFSVVEAIFTMFIIWMGILLLAFSFGNVQSYLQGIDRRRFEMSLRRHDVEKWMSQCRLPEELRRQVREAERFSWVTTRGLDEEMLMENLPENLKRNICRHRFEFVKKVQLFQFLDEPIVDAICEKLRTKAYIKGSKILYRGGLVDKIVFINRGKMESIGEDLIVVPLSEGDVCGEELLTWFLEHSSVDKDGTRIRIPEYRLLSNRLVRCLSNVEAFVLQVSDLEEVASLFARPLRSPHVQGATRYESPYRRGLASRRMQSAWRYRKKRRSRADSTSPRDDYSARSGQDLV